jgi:hypothetical protein
VFHLPLLFCVAHIPLSNELDRANCGYPIQRTERKMNHLLYMDDLNLLGRSEGDLEIEIKILKEVIYFFVLRRLNFICQRFGAPCLSHLHRRIGMKND